MRTFCQQREKEKQRGERGKYEICDMSLAHSINKLPRKFRYHPVLSVYNNCEHVEYEEHARHKVDAANQH